MQGHHALIFVMGGLNSFSVSGLVVHTLDRLGAIVADQSFIYGILLSTHRVIQLRVSKHAAVAIGLQ